MCFSRCTVSAPLPLTEHHQPLYGKPFAGWHLTLCHGSSWCAYDVTAGCKITHCAGAAGAAGKSRSRVRAFGRVFTFPLLTVHVPFLSEKLTLDAAGHIKRTLISESAQACDQAFARKMAFGALGTVSVSAARQPSRLSDFRACHCPIACYLSFSPDVDRPMPLHVLRWPYAID